MINTVVALIESIIRDYPVLLLVMPYIGILCISVVVIAIVTSLASSNPIRIFIGTIPDKIVMGVCMAALAVWVVFVTIFVFPFHCVKNWDQVKLIQENKRLKKKDAR